MTINKNLLIIPTSKLCSGCEQIKDISEFYKRKNLPYSKYQCKSCENKKNRIYQERLRRKNPDRVKEYNKRFKNNISRSVPVEGSPKKSLGFKKKRIWAKHLHYKKKFGLSLLDIKELLDKQLNLCANRACGKKLFLNTKNRNEVVNVDHCHSTGKVRGILCNKCNMALGILEDKNMVLGLTEYLQKHDGG